MADSPRLIFTGNVIVDIVMAIDRMPEPGGDVIASASGLTAGGGYNAMVAAQRDGLPVVFAGQYGTGGFGTIVRTALADAGFAVAQTGIDDVDSGFTVALVDASTERTFVTSRGAEGRLTRADLDRVEVRPADLVYVSGYSLAHPVNAEALPGWLEALPAGVRVLFDPSPLVDTFAPELLGRVLAATDVVSVNAREARLMTGGVDLAAAAVALAGRTRGGAAIVRDGAAGCWVVEQGAPAAELVPGLPVDAVDSNGAGDAHGGVLAAALSRGDDLVAAARRANVAAAIAVTRRGPATAPTAEEIDRELERATRG
ncbi:PfkB family carbohydrate kinase [Leifsonia sp. F6_8S_P_1B]|uniref:PfkB family carbohydrate kinase n=1 Tax=Leifsonia williamsii TaxID=3035919 RepID=A0ABT8K8T3_9MICO|nr:PfkB family carbohydrate kinase [Leifsonia williamsii]MDN4613868.1 PfkB family carbohydrate kinase [Leifsonia williamsii]